MSEPPSQDGAAPLGLLAVRIEEELDSTLQRVAELAMTSIDGCDMAGITLLRDGRPVTAAFTHPDAVAIDATQYRTADGPCLSAFEENRIFRLPNTAKPHRWHQFAATALEHGIQSTLSLPLIVGSSALGALNLYSRTPEALTSDDEAMVFELQAATVLANAQAYTASLSLARNLAVALDARAPIEQAKGILMAQLRCDPDAAFEILRSSSQKQNRKVRDLAVEMVAEQQEELIQPPA